MPKATVRANAQTLPKKSRSSGDDPDRKLLALAAEDRLDQLRIKRARLGERIVDTPARTIRGITAKLTFAGRFITPDQVKERGPSLADAIAMSAAVDASRIAKGRAQ